MSFKSGVKDRRSDRWWQWKRGLYSEEHCRQIPVNDILLVTVNTEWFWRRQNVPWCLRRRSLLHSVPGIRALLTSTAKRRGCVWHCVRCLLGDSEQRV